MKYCYGILYQAAHANLWKSPNFFTNNPVARGNSWKKSRSMLGLNIALSFFPP
jgi:hypothetical protein